MADVTSGSTFTNIVPAQNAKLVIANTAATADGGDTVDFDTYLKTIKGVLLVNNDGSTAIGSGTWSGTVVTIPSTMSDNQTVNMLVWGTD